MIVPPSTIDEDRGGPVHVLGSPPSRRPDARTPSGLADAAHCSGHVGSKRGSGGPPVAARRLEELELGERVLGMGVDVALVGPFGRAPWWITRMP